MNFDLKKIIKILLIYTIAIVVMFDCLNVFGLIGIGPLILNAIKFWNLFILILYIAFYKNEIQLKDILIIIFFIPLFWIYVGEENILYFILKLISRFVPLFSFILIQDEKKLEILKMWLKFYTITLVPALIIHILKLVFSIDFPAHEIINLRGEMYTTHYFLYFFDKWNYIRFCGIYDEPGVIGSFSYLFLLFLNDDLTKFQKIIIWLSGLFSISFFFLATSPLIIIVNLYKKRKFLKILLISCSILVLALFTPIIIKTVLNNSNESQIYQDLVFHTLKTRFNIDENSNSINSIKTNRLNSDNYTFNEFKNDNWATILFGNFTTTSSREFGEKTEGGLGLEIYLYQYGIFMFIYTIFLAFIIGYLPVPNNFTYSIYSFFFTIICLYQKPFLYKIEFIIILYSGALLFHNRKKILNKAI